MKHWPRDLKGRGATGTAGTKRVPGCFARPEVSILSLKDPLWGGCARDGTAAVTREAAEQGADLAAGSPKLRAIPCATTVLQVPSWITHSCNIAEAC